MSSFTTIRAFVPGSLVTVLIYNDGVNPTEKDEVKVTINGHDAAIQEFNTDYDDPAEEPTAPNDEVADDEVPNNVVPIGRKQ